MDFMSDMVYVVRNYQITHGQEAWWDQHEAWRDESLLASTSRLGHTRSSRRRNMVMRLIRSGDAEN